MSAAEPYVSNLHGRVVECHALIPTERESADAVALLELVDRARQAVAEARGSLKGAAVVAEWAARPIWTDVTRLTASLRAAGHDLEEATRAIHGIQLHHLATDLEAAEPARNPLDLAPLRARPSTPQPGANGA
jgi:hypothetical protein